MDRSIVYIATTTQQAKKIRNTLKKMNLNYPVFESNGSNSVIIAKKMIEKYNTRIIVSRGGTMTLLSKELDVPVIDMRHSFIDIWLSMEKAQTLSDSIAIVGYYQICKVAALYKQIMNQPIEIKIVEREDQFYNAVATLKEQGIKLIIGGILAQKATQENGLLFVSSDIDENSIEQASKEAIIMLHLENERIERYKALHTIIDYTIEGIIYIDANCNILHINNNAKRILNYQDEKSLTNLIQHSLIDDSLLNGTINTNKLIEINGLQVILNCIPIIVKGKVISTVITIQKQDDIISLDQKIRKKNAARGHIAKKRFSDIVSKSNVMDELKKKAMQYALSDNTITIYGETGTGKEVLAQSIHNHSRRAHNPFVAINCAALPESILESELFGYASGAFTGARREGHEGIFEQANHGTVFLDEINELSMNVQAKFLRVIQEKEISRIGDNRIFPIDIRIIVASNKRLYDAVESGAFRSDLYYRLCVLELEIPPLRNRKEDIPLLSYSFLKEMGYSDSIKFSQDALDLLCAQNWEGNIRQLYNIIERILATNRNLIITKQQVEDSFGYDLKRNASSIIPSYNNELKHFIDESQTNLILKALEQANGNRTKTAEILSISTSTLWRKMKKYNLL